MKLTKSKNANVNYLAKIVNIQSFRAHSNPEVTRLKCCTIDGFNIITGIDSQPGLYVYFPTACCINSTLLSYCNLYRHKELNSDSEKTGMFEDNGRVKAIRLKGELSEGFILPIIEFQNYIVSVTNQEINIEVGTEFDIVEHEGKTFWINKKYIPKYTRTQGTPGSKSQKGKTPKGIDKIIDGQFRFHYDTVIIKKCPNVIHPDDLISITEKIHGTSGISARVLCKQELNWKQKIAKWLTGEEFNIYDGLYSSRTVIKNRYYNKNVGEGYYGCDVWAEANKVVKACLIKGMTVYYEIVRFLPNGDYIQKNYDYGCVPPKENETYTPERHFKVRVYRVTLTNVDGIVHEFSAREVQQWCKQVGLTPVTEYYYGYAKDLYPDLNLSEHWNENFMARLTNDKNFNMEMNSPSCNNKVPHEGIVIKIENMKSEAFKLKCFKFINAEGASLDAGVSNIEDEN